MATCFEMTVSATEFKAKCLALMDDMRAGQLQRVHITKRGKPFLTMAPSTGSRPSDHIFKVYRGSATIPRELDLTAPVIDAASIEALRD